MARELRASVDIPLPIEQVFEAWCDAARFTQWQFMLIGVRDVSGPLDVAGTSYVLEHGPGMPRHVRVVAVERPVRMVVEQRGMGIDDLTTTTFMSIDGGTRVDQVTIARLNPIMRLLVALDVRRKVAAAAQRELEQFAEVTVRQSGPARVGGVFLLTAGPFRRRASVLAVDPEHVHVRLHAGHLKPGDDASTVPTAPAPLSEQLRLQPLGMPLRSPVEAQNQGLPFLLRDGGHGVAHLALTMSAWADAAGIDLGIDDPVTDDDLAAIAAWREHDDPAVGAVAGLRLGPLGTVLLGQAPDGTDAWAVVKVLRADLLKVHLAVFPERWPTRPTSIRPWTQRIGRMTDEALDAGVLPDPNHGVGHVPVQYAGFTAGKPVFAGVTIVRPEELDAIAHWERERGGTFADLRWIPAWPGTGTLTSPPSSQPSS